MRCHRGQLTTAGRMALGILSLAAILATGAAVAGEEAPDRKTPALGEQRITLSYRRVPLERVLEYLSRAARGINIRISVPDSEEEEELKKMLVTVELSNINWQTALTYIADKYRFVIDDEMEADGVILLKRPPRITMTVQEKPIDQVIKLIALNSGRSIIIGPEVTGTVSFNLQDVPWTDALDSILKAQGFVKVEDESGIIRITTPERVQTQQEIRAVPLRYIQPQGAHYQPELVTEQAAFVSRRSAGGAAGDLEQSLLEVLSTIKSPEGQVTYEPRSNMLILKDTATRIEEMLDIIREIDRAPRQVKITARILTHRIDPDDMTYGVDWLNGIAAEIQGGASWRTTFPFTRESFGQGGPLFRAYDYGTDRPVSLLGDGARLNAVAPAEDSADTTPDYTLGRLSFEQMDAMLKILAERTDVDIVQAPEIVALDNQEATVFIGAVNRYAIYSREVTDGGVSEGLEQEELLAGVQLLVVPHICGDTDNVILEVVPKEEEDPVFQTFSAGNFSLDLPQSNIKIAHTRMMLRSGETGVIAGLMKNQEQEKIRKVPFLGDIPVINFAFRRTERQKSLNNSVIMITPYILGAAHGEDFQNSLEALRSEAASLGLPQTGADIPSAR